MSYYGQCRGSSNPCGYEFNQNIKFDSSYAKAVSSRLSALVELPARTGIVPRQALTCPGLFFTTNRKTALRYTVAETWQAQLWLVLALGHARTDQLTGQQEKVNARALAILSLLVFFFFSLESDNSHMKRPGLLCICLGGLLVFCFWLFLFKHLINMIVLTRELLHKAATDNGGYNRAQLNVLNVPWPPVSGWLESLIGTRIKNGRYKLFVKLRTWKQKPKSMRKAKYLQYLESAHWKSLRKAAFERDNFMCVRCGSEKELEGHHKRYRHLIDCTVNDVETLCRKCHVEHHKQVQRERSRRRNERNKSRRQLDPITSLILDHSATEL